MRALLLASVTGMAFASTACAVSTANDSTVHVMGDEGHASIHVESDDGESVIIVNGQRIEVRDGAVFIDGDRHELDGDHTITIDGGDVRIRSGGGRHFSWRMREGELARAEAEIERAMAMANHESMREVHETARQAIEEALAELEIEHADGQRWVIENGERRELTEAERAEVEAAMREARDEVRDAMREMRWEMREARDEMRNRRVEIRRVERDVAREMARAEREAGRAGRHAERARMLEERLREAGANNVRIEREDGESRVWLDDRELEGDERTEWLNRMQLEELEGGEHDSHAYFFSNDGNDDGRRVMVFRDADGGDHELEFRSRHNVIIELDDGDGEDVQVWEFSSDEEDD